MKREGLGSSQENSLREDLLFCNMIFAHLIAHDLPQIGLCAILLVAGCILMVVS